MITTIMIVIIIDHVETRSIITMTEMIDIITDTETGIKDIVIIESLKDIITDHDINFSL